MARLIFKVASDYKEVIRLREEILKLNTALKSLDVAKNQKQAKDLERQLSTASGQYNRLVSEAAKASAQIENGFKRSAT